MHKSKAIITAVIITAVAVFVVAAVSTVMTGTGGQYERPDEDLASKITEKASDISGDKFESETSRTDAAEQAAEQEQRALDDTTTEEIVDSTAAVVDSATESAVAASDTVVEKASKAVEEAQEAATQGREEAEKMLEEAAREAEKAVTPDEPVEQAEAKEHRVAAQGLVFNPLVVQIAPGDQVSWTNMSTHNTESIEGLIPEDAEMWRSDMSDNYSRTFTEEGIYIYKCTPHFGAGMGGAIIVGEPVNLEQIQNADVKGAAKRLVGKALQVAEEM